MFTLTKILCGLWRCAVPSQGREQTEESNNSTSDDLTAIRGIGIATTGGCEMDRLLPQVLVPGRP